MTFPSVSEASSKERTMSPPRRDVKTPLKIDTSTGNLPRSSTPNINALPPALAAKKHQKTESEHIVGRSRSSERKMDLEKRPRAVTASASAFDMDSPVKGSIWTKMFGKK